MRIISVAAVVLGAVLAAPPAWGGPDSCAALGGFVDGGGRCQVRANDTGYTVNMTFPLDYPDGQAVFDYLGQTRDGFVNVADTSAASRTQPLEMDVTGESLRSAQTQSIVLKLFQDVGSAHPTTWYKSFTYDIGRGTPVTFDMLFAPDANAMEAIFPIVRRELEAETGMAGGVSRGDGMDPSHYQNFAITDDSVIFYFGRAEILPSYAGETSVTVPRSALPPLQL